MERFARRFDVLRLRQHIEGTPDGVLAAIFGQWRLPGEKNGLLTVRVAIRNGYLNLYIGGQSAARVEVKAGKLSLQLHKKYFEGARKGGNDFGDIGQEMVTLSEDALGADNAVRVLGWIETAASYCGDEKLFVEDLIAANFSVIDVEMALPGDDRLKNSDGKKVAPRMDVVTAVPCGDDLCLNFWEAKCASNPELRAQADIDLIAGTGAPVAKQLQRYVQWLALDGREAQVVEAYQNAGSVLRDLAISFGKDSSHPAVALWEQLSKKTPRLVRQPAIAIANYIPRWPRLAPKDDTNAAKSLSFSKHRARLEQKSILVVEVDGLNEKPILPPIPPAS